MVKKKMKKLFPILLVNFIGTLGFSIVLPFLVFLVNRFGGNAFIYGLLGAIYPFFQMIGAPVLGKLSDTYGRRKILIVSQLGTLLAWIIFIIAMFVPITETSSWSLSIGGLILTAPLLIIFFARAVDGLTGGNISVANAYLSDISTESDRNANFGKMSMSGNLGFVLGPALAGLLGATHYGELIPIIAAALISLIATLLIIFYLPESNPANVSTPSGPSLFRKIFGQEHNECYQVSKNQELSFIEACRLKHIPYLFVLNFLIFLSFSVFYTSFPLHAAKGLRWNTVSLGIFFSILSLMMAVVQGPVLKSITKRFSEIHLILCGLILLFINFFLLSFPSPILTYVAAMFFALGNGIMWPSFLSLLSKFAGNTYQGSVQGIANSMGSLASIIGLIAGGILYSMIGPDAFLAAAGIIFCVVFLSLPLLRFNPK